jgi:hypothetical protein
MKKLICSLLVLVCSILHVAALDTDKDGYYVIGSLDDWKEFAAIVENCPGANGKLVTNVNLGNDQTMVGAQTPYQGHFDGQGYTLTVAYYSTESNVAPFRYVSGGIIERLRTAGTMETTYVGVGGVVSEVRGDTLTILRSCWSSALLTSGTGGIGNTIGGLVSNNDGKVIVEDCLFDGQIADKNTIYNAGFVSNNLGDLTIRNSLNLGKFPSSTGYYSGTFFRPDWNKGTAVLDNVYYKNVCGTPQGTAVTDEQLADGTVLDLLQNGRSEIHWIQTETIPVLNYSEYGYETISQEEWQILQAAYNVIEGGNDWKRPWNLSDTKRRITSVPGVTLKDGNIVSINLSDNNLIGELPLSFLSLPHLKKLNLAANHLSCDIGTTAYAFAKKNPTMVANLQELNISDNQLTGNVGLFANCFPSLISLDASGNCLEDVYPMIPATVTTLDISKQTISRVVPLHLAKLSVADIGTKVPSILLYDHANQTFTPNIKLMCTTPDNSWGMMMAYQNGQLAVPYVSEQNTYYGEVGDTLNVAVYNNSGTPEGSTFRITLSFDEGDGNFDGKVNILDLQTTILYIMEKYHTRPYNFTAANLWKDELINVQDIICLVNQLMSAEQEQPQSANARKNAPSDELSGDASVYVQDGKIMLNSIYPVAAFDLLLNGTNSLSVANDLERMGMTFVTRKQADGLHVLAYSMNGACIPSGTTAIGTVDSNAATISNAMLSDSEANAIMVSFSGTDTGIGNVNSSANGRQTIYDLQGRKVNATLSKGLYIKNGHKIIK